MTSIVLLTAVTRPENLPIMYDSIKRTFGRTQEEMTVNGYDILWVIVKDRYNCKGDVGYSPAPDHIEDRPQDDPALSSEVYQLSNIYSLLPTIGRICIWVEPKISIISSKVQR